MLFQFVQRRAAGGDCQDFRADEFSAADVKRCVADHNNFLRAQVISEHAPGTLERGGGDVVAVFVVVRKSAELENVPQSISAQFEFRAKLDITGEQSERGRFRQRLQVADEFLDAVADFAFLDDPLKDGFRMA